MVRPGINTTLFKALVESPPAWMMSAGKNIDGNEINFLPLPPCRLPLDHFLSATTDSVRLVTASEASRVILRQHDMEELEELRERIQLSELLRAIPYARQSDHSGHTLYLYLLGLYMMYRSDSIRHAMQSSITETLDSPRFIDRLFLQWTFASLLHDIGYIFQSNPEQYRVVDRFFRPATILRRLDASDSKQLRFEARKKVLESGYAIHVGEVNTPEDILDCLRLQPWGKSVGLYSDAFETLYYLAPQSSGVDALAIEEFAYSVAATGYSGTSSGVVDHAVASGLMLLSYSTFWYWLAKESGYQGSFNLYRQSYIIQDIVVACFAVAAHNMIGTHGKSIGKLSFSSNPLLYLSVLCDELQKWDRFPAGEEFLTDLKAFADHCTDSEHVTVSEVKGKFRFKYAPSKLADKIEKTLNDRLENWQDFVTL